MEKAARFVDGCLTVNLHIDKLLPQAEIRGYQPYAGLLAIRLKEPCRVMVRIPDFVQAREIEVDIDGKASAVNVWGNYFEIGNCLPGVVITVKYPLPIRSEVIPIQNPGFRQYHYQVTWKGSTVVRMDPVDNDYAEGYSDFDKKQVPVFYGKDGPGQLYLREDFIENVQPDTIKLSPLTIDHGSLDFWYLF